MARRTLVILNPRSGNGRTGRRWEAVERAVRAALGPVEVERTRGPRDAERVAREAVEDGADRLVVAGGDGTLSEVASGLLAADLAGRVEVGVLPLGTGGDFARTLGIPQRVEDAIACIAAGKTRLLDAARVSYAGAQPGGSVTYGVNVTSAGIAGLIVDLVNRTSKAFGGAFSFLVGTLRGIARYRPSPVSVRVDGALVHEGPLLLAAVANGAWFGGGMRVAPEARPDDGLLDTVILGDLSRSFLVRNLHSVYRGTHLELPGITLHRGRVVEATSPDPVPIEVDGEPLGSLPLRVEVLPGALTLIGPA